MTQAKAGVHAPFVDIDVVSFIRVASAASLSDILTGNSRFVVLVTMLQAAKSVTFIHNFSICGFKSKMLLHISSQMVWYHNYSFSIAHLLPPFYVNDQMASLLIRQ